MREEHTDKKRKDIHRGGRERNTQRKMGYENIGENEKDSDRAE